jgi:hypothetical protein
MKSESKKYEPKQPLKKWLISFEMYRLSQSVLYEKATTIVEAESLHKAYDSLRKENMKLYITNVFEL